MLQNLSNPSKSMKILSNPRKPSSNPAASAQICPYPHKSNKIAQIVPTSTQIKMQRESKQIHPNLQKCKIHPSPAKS